MTQANFEPLTDQEWQALEPLFSQPAKRSRGKPHAPWRLVMNAILWILFTGLKWGSLPKNEIFSTKSVAHRWFVIWEKSGFLQELLNTYQNLNESSRAI